MIIYVLCLYSTDKCRLLVVVYSYLSHRSSPKSSFSEPSESEKYVKRQQPYFHMYTYVIGDTKFLYTFFFQLTPVRYHSEPTVRLYGKRSKYFGVLCESVTNCNLDPSVTCKFPGVVVN